LDLEEAVLSGRLSPAGLDDGSQSLDSYLDLFNRDTGWMQRYVSLVVEHYIHGKQSHQTPSEMLESCRGGAAGGEPGDSRDAGIAAAGSGDAQFHLTELSTAVAVKYAGLAATPPAGDHAYQFVERFLEPPPDKLSVHQRWLWRAATRWAHGVQVRNSSANATARDSLRKQSFRLFDGSWGERVMASPESFAGALVSRYLGGGRGGGGGGGGGGSRDYLVDAANGGVGRVDSLIQIPPGKVDLELSGLPVVKVPDQTESIDPDLMTALMNVQLYTAAIQKVVDAPYTTAANVMSPGLMAHHLMLAEKLGAASDADGVFHHVMVRLLRRLHATCAPAQAVSLTSLIRARDTENDTPPAARLGLLLQHRFIPALLHRLTAHGRLLTDNICLINQWSDARQRVPLFFRVPSTESQRRGGLLRQGCMAVMHPESTPAPGTGCGISYTYDEGGGVRPLRSVCFDHCFDTTFDSLPSVAAHMGIGTSMAARRGCLITAFGYSGVGKTFTLFSDPGGGGGGGGTARGVISSALHGAIVPGPGVTASVRATEVYGLRLGRTAAQMRFSYSQASAYKLRHPYTETDPHTFTVTNSAEIDALNRSVTDALGAGGSVENARTLPEYQGWGAGGPEHLSMKGIQATRNNPQSSRSVMILSFGVAYPKAAAEGGSTAAAETVPLTIVDLPGRENVVETHHVPAAPAAGSDQDGEPPPPPPPPSFSIAQLLCGMHMAGNPPTGNQFQELDNATYEFLKQYMKNDAIRPPKTYRLLGKPTPDAEAFPASDAAEGWWWTGTLFSDTPTAFTIDYVGPEDQLRDFMDAVEIKAFLHRVAGVTHNSAHTPHIEAAHAAGRSENNAKFPFGMIEVTDDNFKSDDVRNAYALSPEIPAITSVAKSKRELMMQVAAVALTQQMVWSEKVKGKEQLLMKPVDFPHLREGSPPEAVLELLSNNLGSNKKAWNYSLVKIDKNNKRKPQFRHSMLFASLNTIKSHPVDLESKAKNTNPPPAQQATVQALWAAWHPARLPRSLTSAVRKAASNNIGSQGDRAGTADEPFRLNVSKNKPPAAPHLVITQANHAAGDEMDKSMQVINDGIKKILQQKDFQLKHNLDTKSKFYVSAGTTTIQPRTTPEAFVAEQADQLVAAIRHMMESGSGEDFGDEDMANAALDALRRSYSDEILTAVPGGSTRDTGVIRQVMGTMEGLFINHTLSDIFYRLGRQRETSTAAAAADAGDAEAAADAGDAEAAADAGDAETGDAAALAPFEDARVRDFINFFVFANRVMPSASGKEGDDLALFRRQRGMLADNYPDYTRVGVKYQPNQQVRW
jgi:hypothetical protein